MNCGRTCGSFTTRTNATSPTFESIAMSNDANQSPRVGGRSLDASNPKLEAIRNAREALAVEIMWRRARDFAAKHDGGLTNGLHEHIWHGVWSDYRHDPRYRELIRAFAEVRMLDEAAARPGGVTAQ
jgi:hypothetical protein